MSKKTNSRRHILNQPPVETRTPVPRVGHAWDASENYSTPWSALRLRSRHNSSDLPSRLSIEGAGRGVFQEPSRARERPENHPRLSSGGRRIPQVLYQEIHR